MDAQFERSARQTMALRLRQRQYLDALRAGVEAEAAPPRDPPIGSMPRMRLHGLPPGLAVHNGKLVTLTEPAGSGAWRVALPDGQILIIPTRFLRPVRFAEPYQCRSDIPT